MPISGPILCEKANYFHTKLYPGEQQTFKASRGWLWRFCICHGMRQLSVQGEKLSADSTAPDPFKQTLADYIEAERLTLDQVYNCDETGLYFRLLPRITLASALEKSAPGMKASKDRVTLMACSKATGTHKLRLVIIGKL